MSTDFEQLILTHAPGGAIVTTPEGRVLYWAKGTEAIFGYSSDAAVGQMLRDLIGLPGQNDEAPVVLQALLSHGTYEREVLARRKDGSPVYVDMSSNAIRNAQDEMAFILSTAKDITRLKATRDAKLIEARFRGLLEFTPDSVVIANVTGRIVLANSQAEKLFGYQPGELRGQLIDILLPSRFHQDYVRHRWHYFDQPRLRSMGAGLELYGLRRDGTEFPMEISLSPLETEEGVMVSGTIRDITDRKRIEHALHEKKLELERANLAKDRFLTSMSHELRTPLNAILGFAQLLAEDVLPMTAMQKKDFAQHILTSGKHLLTLINEILDLAKIESGSMALSLEPVALADVLEEARVMIETLAARRKIRLVFPAENPVTVLADRTRLKQIILNLLSNAVKYNRELGMVMVECKVMPKDRVRISVQDTGFGLSPEQLADLFQPFNRLGQEAGTEEGTGIGLVVTKRLAELMGGVIGVGSSVGIGSIFWIELQYAPDPAANGVDDIEKMVSPLPARGSNRGCVLYVEDNSANLRLVEEIFGFRDDLQLISAVNAESGIALARTRFPDVILMDMNLPGISGSEAQKILRDDPRTAHIPVIALTANAMQSEVRQSIEAGFFRYLTKPIRIEALTEAIDSALIAGNAQAKEGKCQPF